MSVAAWLNDLDDDQAAAVLGNCCGASGWVAGMLERRPFLDDAGLLATADAVWAEAKPADVLEALTHHPEIGADVEKLREKFASTADWSAGEQAGVGQASEETLLALRDGNVAYKKKFGHIFVVCASGKSAQEMLGLLQARLGNPAAEELRNAAAEQGKITKLRLQKLDDPTTPKK